MVLCCRSHGCGSELQLGAPADTLAMEAWRNNERWRQHKWLFLASFAELPAPAYQDTATRCAIASVSIHTRRQKPQIALSA